VHTNIQRPISQDVYNTCLNIDPNLVPNSNAHKVMYRRIKPIVRLYARRCDKVHKIDGKRHEGEELWDYVQEINTKLAQQTYVLPNGERSAIEMPFNTLASPALFQPDPNNASELLYQNPTKKSTARPDIVIP
jgi:hypothetical protein